MWPIIFILIALGITNQQVLAQSMAETVSDTATNQPLASPESVAEKPWSFSIAAYTYILPDSRDYVQPTVTADRGRLHLEARYNYEDLETGSARLGYNFAGGEKLAWEFTPMLGGVFGHSSGIAPGYRGSLSWRSLELYSEGEYVAYPGDPSANFFYNWSELTFAPLNWFRFGLVTERTRAYAADRDVQRGCLVGFSLDHVDFTAYLFNPDDKPVIVLGVGVKF